MCSQAATQGEKRLLACQNQPKVKLQTRTRPASHLRALDRKLKVSGIIPTLGQGKCMCSHAETQS